ncbi:zinc finger CCCH domain-containing protein 69 [Gossypium australe]|uniref:Zinc finger CCCH domain-containing protein 69 n=1 Tax=Gossypium australe TaxID=47621 RepID=A0A5B6VKE1_9ROSI|nr:zinc finger CCCH domain-containing protein 69 [Gossypium australe]
MQLGFELNDSSSDEGCFLYYALLLIFENVVMLHAYRDGQLEEVALRHLRAEDGRTIITKNISFLLQFLLLLSISKVLLIQETKVGVMGVFGAMQYKMHLMMMDR